MRKLNNDTYSTLSGNYLAIGFMIIGFTILSVVMFYNEKNIAAFIMMILSFVYLVMLFRLKKIVFDRHTISYRLNWFEKVFWQCDYSLIKSVKVDYISDTKMNNKRLAFHLNDGSILKASATNMTMEELGKICQVHNVKLYYDSDNTYVEYHLPKYE